jgi:hypothetical protein
VVDGAGCEVQSVIVLPAACKPVLARSSYPVWLFRTTSQLADSVTMSQPEPTRPEPAGCWWYVALFFTLFWSGARGGLIGVIGLPVFAFITGFISGVGKTGFPMGGAGPAVTPLSPEAFSNGAGNAVVVGLVGALPIFIIGWLIGVIVNVIKQIRRR